MVTVYFAGLVKTSETDVEQSQHFNINFTLGTSFKGTQTFVWKCTYVLFLSGSVIRNNILRRFINIPPNRPYVKYILNAIKYAHPSRGFQK